MKQFLSLLLVLTLFCSITSNMFAAESRFAEELYAKRSLAANGVLSGFGDRSDTEEVPRIEINTENGSGVSLEKEDGYVDAQICITDTDGSKLTDSVLFKVHGNSTAEPYVAKKAFTFKFSKKTEVLSMGKGKKWILLANCFDPTLLRNCVAFELARELGIPYVSEQRFVELWLDGVYRGCYTLYEPVQKGADRVDIDIESNDGQNDFLLELEASRNEADHSYITVNGLRFSISEPEDPDRSQITYIDGVIQRIINTMKSGSEQEIRSVIDVDSFAEYYLLNEYTKNCDFGYSSVFFFYQNGKLYAGPPWDYDLSLGNLNGELSAAFAKQCSVSDGIMQSDKNFYKWLCQKEWFLNEVKRVYAQHYDYIEGISADGGMLDHLRSVYSDVFNRNFSVWQNSKWWYTYQKKPLRNYSENYEFLKNWCSERNAWLTDYYGIYEYEFLLGDADGNNKVDILDVTVIQRVLAKARDDSDGKITLRAALNRKSLDVTDATNIQRFLAAFSVNYPLNEPASVMIY